MKENHDDFEKAKKLFQEEYANLSKYEALMRQGEISVEELSQIYLLLVNEHKKLLKDMVKMTIISDRIDQKLLKANEKLHTAHERIVTLEKRNSALAMAVTASHELNQPLTVINGNLEMFERTLPKEKITEKQKLHLKKIKKSLFQIENTIAKYHNLKDIQFTNYMDSREMVIFGEDVDTGAVE